MVALVTGGARGLGAAVCRQLAARVKELTDGEGVTTVFDTVGKATFEASLKSLKQRGKLVQF